ncbi:MAG: DNA polymerase III subunit gamma/tau, partial [Alphaproteobacteria bacterium]|nr:DNA polymerase III subunit gamma/tau [Alphaproteobacteria bacterium]
RVGANDNIAQLVSGELATNAVARQQTAPGLPATEPVANLKTFEDMLALIDRRRDIRLKLDVERFIRPINFRPGAITYEPGPGAPNDLAQRLVTRLKEWTGERWLIAAEGGGGAESLWEKQKREEREVRAEIEQHPFVQGVMQAFPGTEIVGIRHLTQPEPDEAPPPEEDGDED